MAFVAAPRASQETSTLVPDARPPSLKLISARAPLVGVREAWSVFPKRPRFTRSPFGAGSVHASSGFPASIKGEDSASFVQSPASGSHRPAVLRRWNSPSTALAKRGSRDRLAASWP